MNELVWGIKNGDLDQVRDIIENKVRWNVAVSSQPITVFSCKFYFNFMLLKTALSNTICLSSYSQYIYIFFQVFGLSNCL